MAGIEVRQVAGRIGAEVTGADLSAAGPREAAVIRRAVLEHKVVFLRGQDLDHAAQVRFARLLGPLLARQRPQSGEDLDGHPEVWTISPHRDQAAHGLDLEGLYRMRRVGAHAGWHTDLSDSVNPPAISVLRAEVVPDAGGDTQWTSLAAAYAGLSEPVRRLADGLSAEHSFFAGYQMNRHDPADARIIELVGTPKAAVHPVVAVHPETGERLLFVNPARTLRVIGMDPPESRRVLAMLFEQATRFDYTVRWAWQPGDVAIWDNRATAHLGPGDFGGQPRVMHRVTVAGDRLAGPSGIASQLLSGGELAAVAS
jgi:taurine dioxygenase